ncbi:hypothetical protein A3F66_00015 [candidate division TM6 bacterium RIFCSPHIGHO2_12_FULL_32_22]|nr:MAG: hypothetical protein A3F66_00015 [candidate division TM6 bacterium RIFCSPHIGHO2_12_FULL_32_22]
MKKNFLIIILTLIFFSDALCLYPFNLFRFDNILLQPYYTRPCQSELSILTEVSANVKGRNPYGKKVNPLQIWNETQDALTMIRGFPADSQIGQLAASLNGVNDDGVRGHFNVCGNYHMNDLAFAGRYYLPKGFFLDLFMPFYFMKLKYLEFDDLTQNITNQDLLTHELLTDNIKSILKDFGCLNTSPWEQSGPGDLVLSVWWKYDFPQEKPWLKNVRVNLRGGATFPTGLKANLSDFGSIPFGLGSAGVFLGGDIEVTWGNCLKAGVDLQFLYLFGKNETLRIATDENQTDLFLLAVCEAQRNFGITQQYLIYLQAIRFFRGMSFKWAYHYMLHQEDELFLRSTTFSNTAANTAEYLQPWTIHSFILMMDYEWKNARESGPKLSLFWQQPFNGRRSLQAVTFGVQFAYAF